MAWHSPKIIFSEMGPDNVIEGGEFENRGSGARMCVVYAVAKVVLGNSKIFYSTKVFFVPSEGCQIVKIPNFDPYLAPPTLGGRV